MNLMARDRQDGGYAEFDGVSGNLPTPGDMLLLWQRWLFPSSATALQKPLAWMTPILRLWFLLRNKPQKE